MFEEISQLVQSALDGYRVCIFAYGATALFTTLPVHGPAVSTCESEKNTKAIQSDMV